MIPPRSPWLLSVLLLIGVSAVAAQTTRTEEQASSDKPPAKSQTAQSDTSQKSGQQPPEKVVRTEKEWRKTLTREQFRVLRGKGTEAPFRNKYDKHFKPGAYACAACGQELFTSDTKFNSGCGWPAFYTTMAGDRINLTPDVSNGMLRTEVTCARCDSHLGHVFRDAPQTPTGNRFCINSVSLKFIPASSQEKRAKQKRSKTGRKPAAGSKSKTDKGSPESDDSGAGS